MPSGVGSFSKAGLDWPRFDLDQLLVQIIQVSIQTGPGLDRNPSDPDRRPVWIGRGLIYISTWTRSTFSDLDSSPIQIKRVPIQIASS